MEIPCVSAFQEKIRTRKYYGYPEPLIKPCKNEGFQPPGRWLQIHLPPDGTLRPMGIIRIPLQFLGIRKTCLCRSTVELAGTSAPTAKSYGYSKPLTEPTEFNDSRQVAGEVTPQNMALLTGRHYLVDTFRDALPKKIRTLN